MQTTDLHVELYKVSFLMIGKSFSFLILMLWVFFCFRKVGIKEEIAAFNRHDRQH